MPEGVYLLSHSVGCLPRGSEAAVAEAFYQPWSEAGGDAWPALPPREESLPSLMALAETRPLFLYEAAEPYTPPAKPQELRFLERTMSKWWQTEHVPGRRVTRDYFRARGDGRDYWVYRDGHGRWYVHGVFA